jgi:diacylglycerol kinase (ATP)
MQARQWILPARAASQEERMNLRLLYNPKAGRGRARRHVAEAVALLRARGAEVDVAESQSPEHLVELASEASAGSYDRIVVCGGDGSLNLAVRKLDLQRATLAILPMGSGDDFAHTLGIPGNLAQACDIAVGSGVRGIDVASAGGVRYMGVAGVGFDSVVAERANRVKLLRGSLVYLYSIFSVLPRFEPISMRVTLDGSVSDEEVMFVVVGNTHRYGGGIAIAPGALPDDELLDVCIVSRCSRWELLKTLPRAYTGGHISSPFVRMMTARKVAIETGDRLAVYADGERLTETPAEFQFATQRLRVAAPAK